MFTFVYMDWPRKPEVISVRLTAEDNASLEAIAHEESAPPSASARRLLLEAIRTEEIRLKKKRSKEKG